MSLLVVFLLFLLVVEQFDHLHCQHNQLELDHHLLLDERDVLAHKLDECQRKYLSIEDEYRSLQETVRDHFSLISINTFSLSLLQKFQNEKELNDAHEVIHRLSQHGSDNRLTAASFMQELQEDFGMYPQTRLNSTIIDDDNNGSVDYPMEEDHRVEVSQTQNASFINEKCLLDELLQTEEVRGKGNDHLGFRPFVSPCHI